MKNKQHITPVFTFLLGIITVVMIGFVKNPSDQVQEKPPVQQYEYLSLVKNGAAFVIYDATEKIESITYGKKELPSTYGPSPALTYIQQKESEGWELFSSNFNSGVGMYSYYYLLRRPIQ